MNVKIPVRWSGESNPDFVPEDFVGWTKWGWAYIIIEGVVYIHDPQDAHRFGLPKDVFEGRVKIKFTYQVEDISRYCNEHPGAIFEKDFWERVFEEVPYERWEVL